MKDGPFDLLAFLERVDAPNLFWRHLEEPGCGLRPPPVDLQLRLTRRLHRALSRPDGRIVSIREGRTEVLVDHTHSQITRESGSIGDVNQQIADWKGRDGS